MSLSDCKTLLLDCQTTGTSAARDHLLEVGWAWMETGGSDPEPRSLLLKVPVELPAKVTEITGIDTTHMESALSPAEAFHRFCTEASHPDFFALAHYAQFERPFLEKFFSEHQSAPSFEIFCSYKIAQRLFPEAPSRNIRGLAGYLGCEIPELRRASDHVAATALIWKKMVPELENLGLSSPAELKAWLQEKSARKKKTAMAFQMSREKRLKFPKGPGIYRMLSKTGEVLYVGKATSLHSRVNSYFRGGVSGDSRKLEMMARVFDIEVLECASPLEAALLENEEIKQRTPRYNKALLPSARELVFFSRDFQETSPAQTELHPLGPVKEGGALLELFYFLQERGQENWANIFYDPVPEEMIQEGFGLYLSMIGFDGENTPGLRTLLAFGMQELRALLKTLPETLEEDEKDEEAISEEAQEPELSPEVVAGKFYRRSIRAAEELRRSKRLGVLLNAEITYEANAGQWHTLSTAAGKISSPGDGRKEPLPLPWAQLGKEDYDRMSVLLSELNRVQYRMRARNP